MTAIGYISSKAGEMVVQTKEVKMGIYNCMSLLPAVLTLMALLVMLFFYPLDKKHVDKNVRILEERR